MESWRRQNVSFSGRPVGLKRFRKKGENLPWLGRPPWSELRRAPCFRITDASAFARPRVRAQKPVTPGGAVADGAP